MSEMENVFTDVVNQEAEEAARAKEIYTVPAGRYRAQLEEFSSKVDDREYFDELEQNKNDLYGRIRWNLKFSLTASRSRGARDGAWESLERPVTFFVRAVPEFVRTERGEHPESLNYGYFSKAVKDKLGKSPTDRELYEFLTHTAMELHVTLSEGGVSKTTGRAYDPRNWLRSVRVPE